MTDAIVEIFYLGTSSMNRFPDTPLRTFLLRLSMPYGMYICNDGREVLFNREYQPIWSRSDCKVKQASPNEYIERTKQIWFYNDSAQPWNSTTVYKHCENVMIKFFKYEDVTKLRHEE
jgi:hypothetical protein